MTRIICPEIMIVFSKQVSFKKWETVQQKIQHEGSLKKHGLIRIAENRVSHQTDMGINLTHADTLHFQFQPKRPAPDRVQTAQLRLQLLASNLTTRLPYFSKQRVTWHVHSQMKDFIWNNTNTASLCAWLWAPIKRSRHWIGRKHKHTDLNITRQTGTTWTTDSKNTQTERKGQKVTENKNIKLSWRFRQPVYRYVHWDNPDLWELEAYTDTQQHRHTDDV